MIRLFLKEVADTYIRSNFERLQTEFRTFPIYQGKFKFMEIELTEAVANFRIRHNLGFLPKDVIQTSLVGAGSLTWNYTLFTKEELDLTTSGACKVRLFVGSYEEGSLA